MAVHSSSPPHVAAAAALLARVAAQHPPAVLASSFGVEDVVLIDLIAQNRLPIGIFTLDTGRLPEETYALMDTIRMQYGIPIAVYAPDTQAVEAYVLSHGPNAFYQSVPLRQACCAVRKTEPLRRALAGRGAWITGLRRVQAVTRREVGLEELDTLHGLPKFNPLAEWSDEAVWEYVRTHGVPFNALHERGFPSIGCAPCTRAVGPGEDIRAGRWWWERAEHRECGLHPPVATRAADADRTVTA